VNDTIEDKSDKDILTYVEKIDELTNDLNDDFLLGYVEAILNILGKFDNGECEDCPFSFEDEVFCQDFIVPEIDLKCKLDECWIESVKKLIKKQNIEKRKIG